MYDIWIRQVDFCQSGSIMGQYLKIWRGSGGSRKWVGKRKSWVSFLPKAVGHGGSCVIQAKDVILLCF